MEIKNPENFSKKHDYLDNKAYVEKIDPTLKINDLYEKRLIEHYPCRNEELEGKKHPDTGVIFERKTVEDSEGNKIEVVVPRFDSVFDTKLPEDKLLASDKEQFKECNKKLAEAIEKDPDLKSKFTKEQIEQIKNGDTPDGYTWHHDAEKGKMQLVDSETHAKTGHTGGRTIWGGGSENR